MVRVLLELGADAGVRDGGGRTALDVARREGWDVVAGVLERSVAERRYRPPGAERSGAELGGSVPLGHY